CLKCWERPKAPESRGGNRSKTGGVFFQLNPLWQIALFYSKRPNRYRFDTMMLHRTCLPLGKIASQSTGIPFLKRIRWRRTRSFAAMEAHSLIRALSRQRPMREHGV